MPAIPLMIYPVKLANRPAAITIPGNIRPNPRIAPETNALTPSSSLLILSRIPVTPSITGIAIFINASPIGAIAAFSLSIEPVNFVEIASSTWPSSLSAKSASSAVDFPVNSMTRFA